MNVHNKLSVGFGCALILLVIMASFSSSSSAQAGASANPATVSAVMLSDLHLDPFHDPAKVPQLVKQPVEEWERILNSPDSPTLEVDLSLVQNACGGKKSTDSSYALLASALHAARAQAPDARFVVVSGDLLVHDLDCRYRAAMKLEKASGDDQSVSAAFAEKTTVFVIKQVESAFAGVPVYMGLGNNDSRCNHNRLDMHDAYLKATGQAVVDGLAGISQAERTQALVTYESAGYYAVTMAAPMERTRLLVLDDIYMMSSFANCEADEKDHAGADEEMAWVTKELDGARRRGERVWVLGHVPPTVNPTLSISRWLKLCPDGHVDSFLSSNKLATALADNADEVRLAIFGHTHMDEFHLLGGKDAGVPMKVVASVSPVDGNTPSFTVGKVAPASASLIDYKVYEASNTTGKRTTWPEEYDFDAAYHQPDFSARSLDALIGKFRVDVDGAGPESQAYQKHFFKGVSASLPGLLWEGYVCSLDHPTAEGFKGCVCSGR